MNKIALINADIWTMDSVSDRREALVIEDGIIRTVGTNAQIMDICLTEKNVNIIDLKGNTVLPGFIDSHIHFESNALAMIQIDLKYPKIKSISDIEEKLKVDSQNNNSWIVGNLYDHNKLEEKRHPNKYDLDKVSNDKPILIFHISGHMVAVNSKALDIAGINNTTPDPPGGKIERDIKGEATGVLYETAFNLVINEIPQYIQEEKIEAIQKSSKMLLENGITSVHDMGVEDYTVDIETYYKMYTEKKLKTRVNILYPYSLPENAISDLESNTSLINKYINSRNDFIKLSGLKCFSDGSLVGRTAAVKEPYKDNTGNGMMLMTNEQLRKMAKLAYDKGLQLGVHAIGDRAIESCLDAFECELKENPKDYRFRIEHCGIGSHNAFKKMEEMNILVASQPQFIYDFGDGILLNYDEEVIKSIYEYKTMLSHNIHLSFSSDAPVTFPNPLSAIRCAINRKTQDGKEFVPAENISLFEAVRAHTYEGAYASFDEDKKGMIKEGFFADIIILSNKLSIDSLQNIKVEKTILNGITEFSMIDDQI
jgi:hypothetical protein